MTSAGKRIPSNLKEYCSKHTTWDDLYVRDTNKTKKVPYRVETRIWERGKGKIYNPGKPTRTVIKTQGVSIPQYKKVSEADTFREYCDLLVQAEVKKDEKFKTEIQDRDIGLIVGIPATAGVAAAGGYFAPSMLKVLKVFLKIN